VQLIRLKLKVATNLPAAVQVAHVLDPFPVSIGDLELVAAVGAEEFALARAEPSLFEKFADGRFTRGYPGSIAPLGIVHRCPSSSRTMSRRPPVVEDGHPCGADEESRSVPSSPRTAAMCGDDPTAG
jgi:hypothetical protein